MSFKSNQKRTSSSGGHHRQQFPLHHGSDPGGGGNGSYPTTLFDPATLFFLNQFHNNHHQLSPSSSTSSPLSHHHQLQYQQHHHHRDHHDHEHDSWSLDDLCDNLCEEQFSTSTATTTNSSSNQRQQQQNLNNYHDDLLQYRQSLKRSSSSSTTTTTAATAVAISNLLLKQQQSDWIKVKKSTIKSPDLLIRTAWLDAETALNQIEKGKAEGNPTALWLRFMIQERFFDLGQWIQKKAGAILFIAALVLIVCLAGLKSVHIEDDIEKLWIEDGGRLTKELQYIKNTVGDGYGYTNQIVIQTPKNNPNNDNDFDTVLNPTALLYHLKVLRTAIQTSVEMFDSTWSFKDICFTPDGPTFDKFHIDSLIENLFPCSIITPLDCFWEGSKLLGPEIPVKIPILNLNLQWTDLNPQQLIDLFNMMKQSMPSSSNSQQQQSTKQFEIIQKFMKRSGITTAYQTKPCLDPLDPECPITAPNKKSGQPPNIGYELTDGCYGFSTKYMHRLEDLIVGGIQKNRSGHIIKAKALQSIIQLMGEQNMFEFHKQTIKVQQILDWSIDKARDILQTWQRKFSEEIEKFTKTTDFIGNKEYQINYFTTSSLTDILRNFSEVNFFRITIGYLIMLAYATYSLSKRGSKSIRLERSQSILAMFGVLIIGVSVASGLGVCALLGLPFNASTTQIIPFLALGLGIDNMFILANQYQTDYMIEYVPHQYRTAVCLKQCGFNILMSSIGNIIVFCSAALIPIPALRYFSLQTAILMAFISIAVIILFPSLASLDLRFRSMYLLEIEQNGSKISSTKLSQKFFINLCFYLFCCRTPKFNKINSNETSTTIQMNRQQQQQQVIEFPISSQPNSTSFLKTSKTTTESSSSSYTSKKQQKSCKYKFSKKETKSKLNNDNDDNDEETKSICRCVDKTSINNPDQLQDVSNEESMFKLMKQQCQRCGGDLRTQCDGQDDDLDATSDHDDNDDDKNGEDFSKSSIDDKSSIQPKDKDEIINLSQDLIESSSQTKPLSSNDENESSLKKSLKLKSFKLSTKYFLNNYFGPTLKKCPVKVLILIIYSIILLISFIGFTKINDGLDLIDIVPRGTNEYEFLQLQKKYFSYYNVFLVTKGNFDYPNNQRLLYEYHQAFNRIDAIIKNDDGGMPEFWLTMFRDWLKDLQDSFDFDLKRGCITREQWFSNASNEAILAFKLLVQTGRNDNPVDKSLILTGRLVNSQGIINPKAFYNYLTAWVSNDPMAYQASQASFKPEPREWIHEVQDVELKILKSPPITYAQIPFHLNNIRTTEKIVQTIQDVRAICSRFEERGLPNFPTGIPFTYWEQYIKLRFYMIMTIIVVLLGIFFSYAILNCSLWTPMIIVLHLILNLIQLFGFMGWIGIKLSALPVVILIISVAISLNSLIHITISFNTSIGNRNLRMLLALQQMIDPVKHGLISTFFGLIMLAFSEFDFVFRHFFFVLGASLLIVTFNSLILLPVILSMIGPKPELIPLEQENRISTPTPPPSPSPILLRDPKTRTNTGNTRRSTTAHFINNPFGSENNLSTSTGSGSSSRSSGSRSTSNTTSNNRYIEALMLETQNNLKLNQKFLKRNSLAYRYRQARNQLQRIHSQLSLSTISEEPSSYQPTPETTPIPNTPIPYSPQPASPQPLTPTATTGMSVGGLTPPTSQQQHEFVVQPEFVVETTIVNNNQPSATTTMTSVRPPSSENGRSSSSSSSEETESSSPTSSLNQDQDHQQTSASSSSTTVTTKVKATAKLTVELHTPSPTPTTTNSTNNNGAGSSIINQTNSNNRQSLQNPTTIRKQPTIVSIQPPTLISFPGANYHHHHPQQQSSYHHHHNPYVPSLAPTIPSLHLPQMIPTQGYFIASPPPPYNFNPTIPTQPQPPTQLQQPATTSNLHHYHPELFFQTRNHNNSQQQPQPQAYHHQQHQQQLPQPFGSFFYATPLQNLHNNRQNNNLNNNSNNGMNGNQNGWR